MKKQLMFVSAVVLSLTFASCGAKTEEAAKVDEKVDQIEQVVEETKEEVKEIKEDAEAKVEEVKKTAIKKVKEEVKKEPVKTRTKGTIVEANPNESAESVKAKIEADNKVKEAVNEATKDASTIEVKTRKK